MAGHSFGRYEVRVEVGAGSSGVVYLCFDPEAHRNVAVKRLAAELSVDPGFRERFRREAQIMAQLNHPNCVKIFDFSEESESPYLVMEYVAGASLREILDYQQSRKQRLTAEQALGLLKGALSALAYTHAKGLVHGDVKPENLLCDAEGNSKLCDFGLAAVGRDDISQDAGSRGSPLYMSPEQVQGHPADQLSDIYACGAMLFELLTGRPPFMADSRLAVMRMHVAEDVPDPRIYERNLAGPVAVLTVRAMAKDPGQRPQTLEAFLSELEAAAADAYGEEWERRAPIAAIAAATISAGGAAAAIAGSQLGGAVVGTQLAGTEAAGIGVATAVGPPGTAAGGAVARAPRHEILQSRRSRIAIAVAAAVLLVGAAVGGLALRQKPAATTASLDPCVVGTWQATESYFILHDTDLNVDNHLTGGQGEVLSIASDGSSFSDMSAAAQFTGSGFGHRYTVQVRGRTATKVSTSGDSVTVTPGAQLEGQTYVADRDGVQFGGGTPGVAKLSTSGSTIKRSCSGDKLAFIDGPNQATFKRTSSQPATLPSPVACSSGRSTADFSVCPAKASPGTVIELQSKNNCYGPGQAVASGLQKPSVQISIYSSSTTNPVTVARVDFPLDGSGQWSGRMLIDPSTAVAPGTYKLGGGCFDAGAGVQNGFGIPYGPIDFEITAG